MSLGLITSFVMPSEALWQRAASEMQSPVVNTLGVSPFAGASVPSAAMVVYAGLFMIAAFSLALRRFSRKDL